LREFGYDQVSPEKRRLQFETLESIARDPLLQSRSLGD
jgi:hypothetical protein